VISCKPSDDPARDVQRAKAIAAGLAPRSVERLAELQENSDPKIALAAINAIRQWSGPQSRRPEQELSADLEVSDEALDELLKAEPLV
jgi:hypothetical protein